MNRWPSLLIGAALLGGCAPANTDVNNTLPQTPADETYEGGGSMAGERGEGAAAVPSNYPGAAENVKVNEEIKAENAGAQAEEAKSGDALPVEGAPAPAPEPAPSEPPPPTS